MAYLNMFAALSLNRLHECDQVVDGDRRLTPAYRLLRGIKLSQQALGDACIIYMSGIRSMFNTRT